MKMLPIQASHTAMTVASIFAQTNISNDRQIRCAFFDFPDRVLDDAILGIGATGLFILRLWNSKKKHRLHSRFVGALRDRIGSASGASFWNSKKKHRLHSRFVGALRDRGDFFTGV